MPLPNWTDPDGKLHHTLTARWGLLGGLEVSELKRHPNRCTVEINAQTMAGRQILIGKFYGRDRSDVFRTMQKLYDSGFGSDQEFSIPQPLAFIQDQHLLLQQKVIGTPATDFFLSPRNNNHIRAAERCAQWLTNLHQKGPAIALRPVTRSNWLNRIARRDRAQSELSSKANSLRELLESAPPFDEKFCGCHGSYSHKQIILNEGRTIVFDWDKYCVADPASDVANFIMGLKQLSLSSPRLTATLDEAIGVFLNTYAVGNDLKVRLPFYLAGQCLRRAHKHSKLGIKAVEALLVEGLRALQEPLPG
jgi:hypothetical protein